MRKREKLMNTDRWPDNTPKYPIDFLDAHNGGIRMHNETGVKGWAKTAEGVAYTLKTIGIADTVMGCSSMEFASEYGFETDDGAMLLYKRALELI